MFSDASGETLLGGDRAPSLFSPSFFFFTAGVTKMIHPEVSLPGVLMAAVGEAVELPPPAAPCESKPVGGTEASQRS